MTGHPSDSLLVLLRLAELLSKDHRISIFSLDYSRAPEAKIPRQAIEAAAAYRYFQSDLGVDSEKIAVIGESAGGHIAVSLAVYLHEERLLEPKEHRRTSLNQPPGQGLILLSPWVNLRNNGESFTRNAEQDFVSKMGLDENAKCAYDWEATPSRFGAYQDFTNPNFSWNQILTGSVLVSLSSDEVMYDDILSFVRNVRETGLEVELSIAERKAHCPTTMEMLGSERRVLDTTPGVEPDLDTPEIKSLAAKMLRRI